MVLQGLKSSNITQSLGISQRHDRNPGVLTRATLEILQENLKTNHPIDYSLSIHGISILIIY